MPGTLTLSHIVYTDAYKNTKAIVYSWSQFQLQGILGSLLLSSQFHEAKCYILAHFILSRLATPLDHYVHYDFNLALASLRSSLFPSHWINVASRKG